MEVYNTHFALPSIYGESLSYYEQIVKLCRALNDLSDYVKNALGDFTTTANAYTDKKVDEAFREINAKAVELSNSYKEFETLVKSNLTLFQTQMDLQFANMRTEITAVNSVTDRKIEVAVNNLRDEISSESFQQHFLNPITGQYILTQDFFNFLCTYHTAGGISVAKFIAKEITANEYVNKAVTAYQLVTNGLNLL